MAYVKRIISGVVQGFSQEAADGSLTLFSEAPGNKEYDKMLLDVAEDPSCITEQDDTPVPTYADLRQATVADGGYGTIQEQLEMLGEQGQVAFEAHVQAVKVRFPK